jgi:hypothetical protein
MLGGTSATSNCSTALIKNRVGRIKSLFRRCAAGENAVDEEVEDLKGGRAENLAYPRPETCMNRAPRRTLNLCAKSITHIDPSRF